MYVNYKRDTLSLLFLLVVLVFALVLLGAALLGAAGAGSSARVRLWLASPPRGSRTEPLLEAAGPDEHPYRSHDRA